MNNNQVQSKRASYDAHPTFVEYQNWIVKHPVYAGMPDAYFEDGSIQWEAPSNRNAGQFKDTHDKRLAWWREKAASIGISTSENEWISKTAKAIHPTKHRPCKKCGQVMDIRYVYLNMVLIKRIMKAGLEIPECDNLYFMSILDYLKLAYDTHGMKLLCAISGLLQCAQFPEVPVFRSIEACLSWVENVYIPAEPKLLGPGAMANPPDRFDGFHSFNRCCRASADKGRSRENLASYATDRRAFENWSDGNWITANKLMGLIRTDLQLSAMPCHFAEDGGVHPTPCSADHIGPISLGFMHRPAFQLLCTPCNSAKNNRMFFSDVCYLRQCEERGEQVVSWYAKAVWDALKSKVLCQDDATRLSRVMRDNRFNAMITLGQFLYRGDILFLCQMLNLSYANFSYSNPDIHVDGEYVSASFTQSPCSTMYGLEQKVRKVRVAIDALREYLRKEQRNGLYVCPDENNPLFDKAYWAVTSLNSKYGNINERLSAILNASEVSEPELSDAIRNMPDLTHDIDFVEARRNMQSIMDNIGVILADNWNADRYSRDLNYTGEFTF